MIDPDLSQDLADLRDAGETFEPAPTAAALLARLRERGLRVEPADAGGIRCWPQRLLGAEDRAHLEVRLDDLVNLLGSERRPTVSPQLRARMAALLELARERLGDEFAQRLLGLFAVEPERAVFEIENALATRAAQGRVDDAAMAVFRWLVCRPGRVARFGEVMNAHGDQHILAGRDTDPEYSREVARVAGLLDALETAGLIERRGENLAAVLPEGVAS